MSTSTTSGHAVNILYQNGVNGIEGVLDRGITGESREQVIEIIRDVTTSLLRLSRQQCPHCQSKQITITCDACSEAW